jgi:hypothetical protein
MLIAGEALDHVHIGLVHQLQELPRVGAQALHIAALALGIQRVEGQAGLARARQPGDHHQLVARDVEVDVLQVVGARPAGVAVSCGGDGGGNGVTAEGAVRQKGNSP